MQENHLQKGWGVAEFGFERSSKRKTRHRNNLRLLGSDHDHDSSHWGCKQQDPESNMNRRIVGTARRGCKCLLGLDGFTVIRLISGCHEGLVIRWPASYCGLFNMQQAICSRVVESWYCTNNDVSCKHLYILLWWLNQMGIQ